MLRLGRLCAGADAARHVATTSASAGTKKPPPPLPAKGKATAKSALSPKPRPATAAATQTTPPKKEHEPIRPKHGRLTRKARPPRPAKWTRRNRRRTGRPAISLDSPRRWNRPLPVGVLPAYDAALDVIRQDARQVRKQAVPLRRQIARLHAILCGEVPGEKVEGEARRAMEAELEALRAKLRVLDVQSEVNLPEVRWSVANAMADMSVPSHRHLVEQRWRKDGDLDLLMERLHQMHVIPDALPVLHPSLDLHVTARLMPEHFESLMKRNKFQRRVNTFKGVVPGNYLTPRQTRVMPKLYANVFHTDVRLYTMLLVDLDVPDEANQTYTTFLHWLKPNIPLSATHMGRIPLLNTHTRYIPPHPQRGTPYHRYTLLLLPQPPVQGRYTLNTEALLTAQQARLTQSIRDTAAQEAQRAAEIIPDDQRLGFNIRAFAKQYGLNGALGGGAHMWREVWDKYVGAVYRYELRLDIDTAAFPTDKTQPMYGRPPRDDPQREAHSAPTRRKYRVA
ncbi:phosphatidylethanolamine-binding protein [Mycena polygramma]|nr:phosphatidylethanolamine-binding protein [Mycena polygramma]